MIARPTTSPVIYSQMLGRGLRGPKFGGKTECLLIDLKDFCLGYKMKNLVLHCLIIITEMKN